jgi:hypothetical protein
VWGGTGWSRHSDPQSLEGFQWTYEAPGNRPHRCYLQGSRRRTLVESDSSGDLSLSQPVAELHHSDLITQEQQLALRGGSSGSSEQVAMGNWREKKRKWLP